MIGKPNLPTVSVLKTLIHLKVGLDILIPACNYAKENLNKIEEQIDANWMPIET